MLDVDSEDVEQYFRRQQRKLEGLRREAKIYFSATLNRGQIAHLALLFDIAFVSHNNADGSIVKEPFLVMEWASARPHNTLKAWMQFNSVSQHGLQERLSLAIQMFSGLVELHRGGHHPKTDAAAFEGSLPLFVHQDIKPANMLLFGHGQKGSGPFRLALTDFGLSACYNGASVEAACGGGTRAFMAPEQWLGMPARTPGRDIWAAGMVLAKLFAGASTSKALRHYNIFCNQVWPRNTTSNDIIKKFHLSAVNIAHAMKQDGTQRPVSRLSCVQQAIAPLLQKCFRVGRELGGAMFAGFARPTSSQCEEFLKTIWQDTLGFPSWDIYHTRLPRPQPTALQQQLQCRGPHNLAFFYLNHMEVGMLTMMLRQCERLLAKVDSRDRPIVEKQILSLRQQLRKTDVNAKLHLKKAREHVLTASNERQVNNIWSCLRA